MRKYGYGIAALVLMMAVQRAHAQSGGPSELLMQSATSCYVGGRVFAYNYARNNAERTEVLSYTEVVKPIAFSLPDYAPIEQSEYELALQKVMSDMMDQASIARGSVTQRSIATMKDEVSDVCNQAIRLKIREGF